MIDATMMHQTAPRNRRTQLIISLQLWRIRKNLCLLRTFLAMVRKSHSDLQLAAASTLSLLIYINVGSAQLQIDACGRSGRWHCHSWGARCSRCKCSLNMNDCWLLSTLMKPLVWATGIHELQHQPNSGFIRHIFLKNIVPKSVLWCFYQFFKLMQWWLFSNTIKGWNLKSTPTCPQQFMIYIMV